MSDYPTYRPCFMGCCTSSTLHEGVVYGEPLHSGVATVTFSMGDDGEIVWGEESPKATALAAIAAQPFF